MKLSELKQAIINKNVSDDLIIFIAKDNNFLANQYVNAICELKRLNKVDINSIYEPLTSSLSTLLENPSELNILRTDIFEELAKDYTDFKNTIVICNKIDKKLESVLSEYIITLPKLESWQIQAYIKTLCPVLSKEDIAWLYEATGGDIYKISNEIAKITIFNEDEQKLIFSDIKTAKNSDLYSAAIFELSNAIVSGDKIALYNFYGHSSNIDIDPIAISTLVLNNLKKILLVCYSGKTAADLGMDKKQFNGVMYYNKSYPLAKLQKSIDFLSKIDLKLKSSELDLSKQKLLDYIICKLAV